MVSVPGPVTCEGGEVFDSYCGCAGSYSILVLALSVRVEIFTMRAFRTSGCIVQLVLSHCCTQSETGWYKRVGPSACGSKILSVCSTSSLYRKA